MAVEQVEILLLLQQGEQKTLVVEVEVEIVHLTKVVKLVVKEQ